MRKVDIKLNKIIKNLFGEMFELNQTINVEDLKVYDYKRYNEFITCVEKQFKIKISDGEIYKFTTVNDIRNLIAKRLHKKLSKKVYVSLILLPIISLLILYSGIRFDRLDKMEVNVGDSFVYKMSASFFSHDISKKISQTGKVNTNKVGKYEITYSYITKLGLKKKKKVSVFVVDRDVPKITLLGSNKIDLLKDDEFTELGYEVSDNYDTNVKVDIKGTVDTAVPGNYYLTYKATDSSGNTSEVVRKIVVNDRPSVDLPIDQFNINNYFDNSVILGETEDFGDEYLQKIYFVGDSVPWNFALQYQWNPSKVWATPCTGPSNIYSQKVYWNNNLIDKTIPELIKENQPEYLLVSIGFCEIVSLRNPNLFISNYGKFLEDIQKNSPNTKIILNSMNPVISETLRGSAVPTNKQVNEYNYYTALVAKQYGVKYLDSASVLKSENGLASPYLTSDDGYHPNVAGMTRVVQYVKNHGYK